MFFLHRRRIQSAHIELCCWFRKKLRQSTAIYLFKGVFCLSPADLSPITERRDEYFLSNFSPTLHFSIPNSGAYFQTPSRRLPIDTSDICFCTTPLLNGEEFSELRSPSSPKSHREETSPILYFHPTPILSSRLLQQGFTMEIWKIFSRNPWLHARRVFAFRQYSPQ